MSRSIKLIPKEEYESLLSKENNQCPNSNVIDEVKSPTVAGEAAHEGLESKNTVSKPAEVDKEKNCYKR